MPKLQLPTRQRCMERIQQLTQHMSDNKTHIAAMGKAITVIGNCAIVFLPCDWNVHRTTAFVCGLTDICIRGQYAGVRFALGTAQPRRRAVRCAFSMLQTGFAEQQAIA